MREQNKTKRNLSSKREDDTEAGRVEQTNKERIAERTAKRGENGLSLRRLKT